MNGAAFLLCAYCHGPISVGRDRSTRQGSYSLQGAGHFCSRICGRVFLSLQKSPVVAPESVYGFSNPPLLFRVMGPVRRPDGIDYVVIAESQSEGHAVRMAAAYPFRAVVQDWHCKLTYTNWKEIPGSAVA